MPTVLRRLWSRRWVRRLTYLLAAGACLTGVTAYVVSRPATDRWILARLDTIVQDETGLTLTAEQLDVHPLEGRILIHRLALGGDLFRAELLELDLEWRSLLRQPHLRAVRLVNPSLILDKAHLARLRLKEHPPAREPLKVRLDRLEIRGGRVRVAEPAWGLPAAEGAFQVDGHGHKANQMQFEVRFSSLALGEAKARLEGGAFLKGMVSDQRLDLTTGQVHLGHGSLACNGAFTFKGRELKAAVPEGSLDLAEVLALAVPGQPPAASGTVAFTGQAQGPLDRLLWKAQVDGRDLVAQGLRLHPGTLHASAKGAPRLLNLEDLQWTSQDGRLTAHGNWTRAGGSTLEVEADGIDLAPAAAGARADGLKDLQARFHGKASLPGAPWDVPRLDLLTFQGEGQFLQDGERVGSLGLAIASSKLRLTDLRLDLPEAEVRATASATLGRRGLLDLDAEGDVRTDAREVATVLKAWDIGLEDASHHLQPFDMEGMAHATATFSWTPAGGIRLRGRADLANPRYHGARADTLAADVAIDRDELRLTDLTLTKGAGDGYGELWLTWADLPPGAKAIDMCYRVSRLPIHEGLKAADQGDLAITGTGSGWARLYGPYDHMLMEGRGVAEHSEVYGLQLPAASADFRMDLRNLRLETTDVRIADTLEHLATGSEAPTGALALKGAMTMHIDAGLWEAELAGTADSLVLGLPGPRLQGQVSARIDGPLTSPWGPYQLPTGTVDFHGGRLSQGAQNLEGLQASFRFQDGRLGAQVGLEGKPARILDLDAHQVGPQRLSGTVRLNLGPDSADTAKLAAELSQNFLKDALLQFQAQGTWGPEGLNFTGSMDHFRGQFDGFHLVQARPGEVDGDGSGVLLNLVMEGHTDQAAPAPQGSKPLPAAPPAALPVPLAVPAPPVTTLTLAGGLPFSLGGPLSLQVDGSAEMANLKTILDHVFHPAQYSLLADMHPGGTARLNLHLGGTPAEATLDGTLKVQNGRVTVSTYPQSAENVDFTAHFKGRDIFILESEPLRGLLAQGALTAWGKAGLEADGASKYDLHAHVEDFQVRDLPEGFDLVGSADATLKGNDQDGGLLKGTVWARHMNYHADINLSDIMLANAGGATASLNALDPSDPLARIDLDLDLHLAEPWEVDTNLLKLRGRPDGPFRLMGTLAQPGIKGKMELLPGGRITNLLPTDVVLEHGSIEFKDPTTFNPNIDLQGRVDVPPYLVMLGLTGTPDHLQVSSTSTPTLRQDEIVAILIDPDAANTVGSSSAFSSQGVINTGLASSSTGLISSLALANFQESLRRTLSLDRVNVVIRSGLGVSDTAVTIGKSYEMFGYRVPVVLIHRKEGDLTTVSGQLELRLGDFVVQMGGSQTTGSNLNPSGEIRHSWSPK